MTQPVNFSMDFETDDVARACDICQNVFQAQMRLATRIGGAGQSDVCMDRIRPEAT